MSFLLLLFFIVICTPDSWDKSVPIWGKSLAWLSVAVTWLGVAGMAGLASLIAQRIRRQLAQIRSSATHCCIDMASYVSITCSASS